MPSPKTIKDIKLNLLHPATTSHFAIEIPRPKKLTEKYLSDNGINISNLKMDKLQLLCSETVLPGSNLATLELNNDHTGVTERHAYRRIYDDRIDFTFYVDAQHNLPIRFFEIWLKYITQENLSEKDGVSSRYKNYFYRLNYPDNYIVDSGLKVIKFERSSYGQSKGTKASVLVYEFIRAFPISISSMPVSYDSSSLLKCNVSMTYIRYIVENLVDPPLEKEQNGIPSTPIEQAHWNDPGFGEFGVDKTGIESPTTFLPGQFGTNSNIPSFTTFVPGQSRFTGAGGPAELAQINRDIG